MLWLMEQHDQFMAQIDIGSVDTGSSSGGGGKRPQIQPGAGSGHEENRTLGEP